MHHRSVTGPLLPVFLTVRCPALHGAHLTGSLCLLPRARSYRKACEWEYWQAHMDESLFKAAARLSPSGHRGARRVTPGLLYHALHARNFLHNPSFSAAREDNAKLGRGGTAVRAWVPRDATNGGAAPQWTMVCTDDRQVPVRAVRDCACGQPVHRRAYRVSCRADSPYARAYKHRPDHGHSGAVTCVYFNVCRGRLHGHSLSFMLVFLATSCCVPCRLVDDQNES